jgi:hypothetical protein
MYPGVPTQPPVAVSVSASSREPARIVAPSGAAGVFKSLAIPKSTSFTSPSSAMSTLSGLRSR